MDKEAYDTLECGQKWYWATFFVSLIHITWISYFMVEFMLKIGCLWGIPDVVMGLTFLAMGTSIPDALGSISVTPALALALALIPRPDMIVRHTSSTIPRLMCKCNAPGCFEPAHWSPARERGRRRGLTLTLLAGRPRWRRRHGSVKCGGLECVRHLHGSGIAMVY